MVDVSVILLTYHQEISKIMRTIDSIMNQRDVSFEIIISEDSPDCDFYSDVEEYFVSNLFEQYTFIQNKENKGTVRNILDALSVCNGNYVKPISPGDMLYGPQVLKECKTFLDNDFGHICFGELVSYRMDGQEKIIVNKSIPADIKPYGRMAPKEIGKHIIETRDGLSGAAFFAEKEFYEKYIKKIDGTVKYAEDYSSVMMLLDGEKISYLPLNMVWYECDGSGVSTVGSIGSNSRMMNDEINFYRLLLEMYPSNRAEIRTRLRCVEYAGRPMWKRIPHDLLLNPKFVWFYFKHYYLTKHSLRVED